MTRRHKMTCVMIGRLLSALTIGGLGLVTAEEAAADSGGAYGASPVSWQISGGFSSPVGQISDYLQGGWIFSGGFTYTPRGSALGLRGDLSFSSHNATNNFLAYGTQVTGVQVDSGSGQFVSFSLGPTYSVPFIGRTRAYGFAQVGVYYSDLQLSQTVLFAGEFCDPYFGFCDFGVFPGDNVVYEDTRTRFGWNAGLGVEFASGYFGNHFFIEASYHRLSGPQPIEYVPIEFGIRF